MTTCSITAHSGITFSTFASGSSTDYDAIDLPPLETLLTWVHRPMAIAKCHISDLYAMRTLVPEGQEKLSYASREMFLLNLFPCKMVEIVAWVAGVDHKESSMTVTLDDGSGDHVLPVLVRLTVVKPPQPVAPAKSSRSRTNTANTFASARERIAKRKAEMVSADLKANGASSRPFGKVYDRKDIRVGDVVRVVGKVDEWQRRKATGEVEWVRQVTVEEGAGSSIMVVDPDVQYLHTAQVYELHHSMYSRPFRIPESAPSLRSQPSTPIKSLPRFAETFEPSSEAPSELTMADEDEPELRDPNRLRSSQLTDRTFRHYMLDHMTQETIKALRDIAANGPASTRMTLETFFPEYKMSASIKGKAIASSSYTQGVFAPSTKYNSQPVDNTDSTPKRTSFASKPTLSASSSSRLQPFNTESLLANDRLSRLALLVVDNEMRKEEKRRRRRIRDGQATKQDLSIEADRKLRGVGVGSEYLANISVEEKRCKMEKLVNWVIRNVAEEGSLIQVHLTPSCSHGGRRDRKEWGYLPVPPQLLFPLLVPLLKEERGVRKRTIRRKGQSRHDGMTVDEICSRVRCWGEEGRWERIGGYVVEQCIEWAEERGWLIKEGKGWWLVDGVEG